MNHSRLLIAGAGAALVALTIALSTPVSSQQRNDIPPRLLSSSTHTNSSCELGAVLGEFARELRDKPDTAGYVVVYSDHNDPPGLFHRHALGVRNVLVNQEHIAADRIIILNAGSRDGFVAEYQVVSKDAPAPAIGRVWQPELQQAGPGKFDEFICGFGANDIYEYGSNVTRLDGFAQALMKNPDAVGYIVGYANGRKVTYDFPVGREGEGRLATRTFRMTGKVAARWISKDLVELLKGTPSRVIIMDGGYRRYETVELWIVPKGESAPKPTPTIKQKGLS